MAWARGPHPGHLFHGDTVACPSPFPRPRGSRTPAAGFVLDPCPFSALDPISTSAWARAQPLFPARPLPGLPRPHRAPFTLPSSGSSANLSLLPLALPGLPCAWTPGPSSSSGRRVLHGQAPLPPTPPSVPLTPAPAVLRVATGRRSLPGGCAHTVLSPPCGDPPHPRSGRC